MEETTLSPLAQEIITAIGATLALATIILALTYLTLLIIHKIKQIKDKE